MVRGKAGSAGVSGGNGEMSRYNSESVLPNIKNKHVASLANFKQVMPASKPTSLVRAPVIGHSINGKNSQNYNNLGLEPINKRNTFQSQKSVPLLVKFRDTEKEHDNKELQDDEEDFLKLCPMGCGRKFGIENLEKHTEICQKVFTGRRDPYDSSKKRWTKVFKK